MLTNDSTRVVIAVDKAARASIRSLLAKQPDLQVVGEIGDETQIEPLVELWQPDVLVLDVAMPGLDPVTIIRCLKKRHPNLNVLALIVADDDAYVAGLLAAGATGYLLKEEALDMLVAAIRAVTRGRSWISQRVAGRLARRTIALVQIPPAGPLTPREREVLRLLALGLSNTEIAEQLLITKRTVQNYVSTIYSKLELDSRTEAVLYAIRHGIVDVSEVKGT